MNKFTIWLFTLKPGGEIRSKYKKIQKNNKKICIYQKKVVPLPQNLSNMTCFAT